MEYYNLIIITKKQIKIDSKYDFKFFDQDFSFIDDAHIIIDKIVYEFNYLIYSDKIKVSYPTSSFILLEDFIPITNFYHQTSLENIYYINEKNLEQDIKLILES